MFINTFSKEKNKFLCYKTSKYVCKSYNSISVIINAHYLMIYFNVHCHKHFFGTTKMV